VLTKCFFYCALFFCPARHGPARQCPVGVSLRGCTLNEVIHTVRAAVSAGEGAPETLTMLRRPLPHAPSNSNSSSSSTSAAAVGAVVAATAGVSPVPSSGAAAPPVVVVPTHTRSQSHVPHSATGIKDRGAAKASSTAAAMGESAVLSSLQQLPVGVEIDMSLVDTWVFMHEVALGADVVAADLLVTRPAATSGDATSERPGVFVGTFTSCERSAVSLQSLCLTHQAATEDGAKGTATSAAAISIESNTALAAVSTNWSVKMSPARVVWLPSDKDTKDETTFLSSMLQLWGVVHRPISSRNSNLEACVALSWLRWPICGTITQGTSGPSSGSQAPSHNNQSPALPPQLIAVVVSNANTLFHEVGTSSHSPVNASEAQCCLSMLLAEKGSEASEASEAAATTPHLDHSTKRGAYLRENPVAAMTLANRGSLCARIQVVCDGRAFSAVARFGSTRIPIHNKHVALLRSIPRIGVRDGGATVSNTSFSVLEATAGVLQSFHNLLRYSAGKNSDGRWLPTTALSAKGLHWKALRQSSVVDHTGAAMRAGLASSLVAVSEQLAKERVDQLPSDQASDERNSSDLRTLQLDAYGERAIWLTLLYQDFCSTTLASANSSKSGDSGSVNFSLSGADDGVFLLPGSAVCNLLFSAGAAASKSGLGGVAHSQVRPEQVLLRCFLPGSVASDAAGASSPHDATAFAADGAGGGGAGSVDVDAVARRFLGLLNPPAASGSSSAAQAKAIATAAAAASSAPVLDFSRGGASSGSAGAEAARCGFDILGNLTAAHAALWLHDVEPLFDIIYNQSMAAFKLHKSSIQVCFQVPY
jgi:hypothetical protein